VERKNISSGSPWENKVGYSRAVKCGDLFEVSGTTAFENGQVIGKGDPYQQTVFILQKIKRTLEDNGASLKDVIRTRMYVTNINNWETIGKAHAKFFADIKPAATMVEVNSLIDKDLLVEIEVTARISTNP